MLTVGLTGGIGSGKSIIADLFSHLKIPVFNADAESKKILDEDRSVRDQLTEWFGSDLYTDGKVNRGKLAGIIFNDPAALAKTNNLLHPGVLDRFIRWTETWRNEPYVIHEAAILFESGIYKKMDTTILVTAPLELRISRVMKRDKTSEDIIRQRIRNQWPDEQKALLAGYIINNDGKSPVLPRVIWIHNELLELNLKVNG